MKRGGTSYRLEWREPVEVTGEPGFGLCRDLDRPCDVAATAAELTAGGAAADGEFYVAILDESGRSLARVLTNAHALEAWSRAGSPLPTAIMEGRWEADLAREAAATRAFQEVQTRLREAVQAGALTVRDAMPLVAASRRLLDPHQDPDEC